MRELNLFIIQLKNLQYREFSVGRLVERTAVPMLILASLTIRCDWENKATLDQIRYFFMFCSTDRMSTVQQIGRIFEISLHLLEIAFVLCRQ